VTITDPAAAAMPSERERGRAWMPESAAAGGEENGSLASPLSFPDRFFAFCMSRHSRLGANPFLKEFSDDVLKEILRLSRTFRPVSPPKMGNLPLQTCEPRPKRDPRGAGFTGRSRTDGIM